MQRLNTRYPYQEPQRGNAVATVIMIIIALMMGMGKMFVAQKYDKATDRTITINRTRCDICHYPKKQKLVNYFKKKGSPRPEEMADGVLRTRNPRLLAAISVVETGGDPAKRNTGFKRRHSGAFQVNPKYWGAVPKDAAGQAKQAQDILDDLQDKGKNSIVKTLNAYGGDETKRTYAYNVLRELESVPK